MSSGRTLGAAVLFVLAAVSCRNVPAATDIPMTEVPAMAMQPAVAMQSAGSGGRIASAPAAGAAGMHETTVHVPVAGSTAATVVDEDDAGVGMPPSATGTLPAIMDPSTRGPFGTKMYPSIGPAGTFTGIGPTELGQGGVKHPVFVWSNGGGIGPEVYKTLMDFVASHGIFVMSYNSTAQSTELLGALDWLDAQSKDAQSPFQNKLDPTKIAAGGQSYGSLGAFWIADDPRISTTVHINGGTLDDHADAKKLRKAALFLCGDDPEAVAGDGYSKGDVARPNCDADFEVVTTPVWYGVVVGSSHTTIIDDPLGMPTADDPLKKPYLAATVAWLRWLLADDQTFEPWFVGSDCRFCMNATAWKVQQKKLQ